MWDITTDTVIGALNGLSAQADLRADNVANAETPGFRASHVDFASQLREAVARGDAASVGFEATPTPSVVDARGNSVDLETELIGAMRDGLLRDAMVAAFNFKAGQARMAIGGHR